MGMDSRLLHPDATLPDDPEQLKAMILELLGIIRTTQRQRDGLQQRLDQLLRRLYGPRSERIRPDQPTLFEIDKTTDQPPADGQPPAASAPLTPANDTSVPPNKKKRRGKPHGRRKLPENLRRERVEYDLCDAQKICPCCGEPRVKIGEDVSEQLDYVPASLFVRQHVCFKYACGKCGSHGTATGDEEVGGAGIDGPTPVPAVSGAVVSSTEDNAQPPVEQIEPNATVVVPQTNVSIEESATMVVPQANASIEETAAVVVPTEGNVTPPAEHASVDASPARPVAVSCGIVTAQKPPQPIHKGLPGPGLLAYVAVSKYAHHLPLYRIEQIIAGHGHEMSRGTLCGWVGAVAELLTPLYQLMLKSVLSGRVVQCDETPVPVLDPDLHKTKTGRLWGYHGDRERGRRFTVFDYRPDKSRAGPEAILKDYRGFLQADAANVFDGLYRPDEVIEVGCWAHCRRKFHEAQTTDALRSAAALAQIREFYKVEKEAKELIERDALVGEAANAVRLRLRQEKTVAKLDEFSKWLEREKVNVLPQSPMGQAIAYAQNHAAALRRFTEHGFLEIDNNTMERGFRPVAVGRKNYLFFGNEEGGKRAAVIYSLTYTCRDLGIDAFTYLRDVLERLPSTPASALPDLLPDRWAQLQRERDRVGS